MHDHSAARRSRQVRFVGHVALLCTGPHRANNAHGGRFRSIDRFKTSPRCVSQGSGHPIAVIRPGIAHAVRFRTAARGRAAN